MVFCFDREICAGGINREIVNRENRRIVVMSRGLWYLLMFYRKISFPFPLRLDSTDTTALVAVLDTTYILISERVGPHSKVLLWMLAPAHKSAQTHDNLHYQR